MELLLNDLFGCGAVKNRLKVKLFGGARISNLTSDPGKKNADFILKFVKDEGLDVVSSSLRGDHGRRIEFHPSSGRVRQKLLIDNFSEAEKIIQPRTKIHTGELELF